MVFSGEHDIGLIRSLSESGMVCQFQLFIGIHLLTVIGYVYQHVEQVSFLLVRKLMSERCDFDYVYHTMIVADILH